MALNFGVLQTASPVTAFYQGQQDVAQNALAQQKMAQEQEMNALRRQQMQLGLEQTRNEMLATEENRAKARRVERAALFRDRLLRAATPEAAREIVKMQYADPDLAPVLSQASTLEQALAEVPDDPNQFETYRQQEAMGMGEWMKTQMPKTVGNFVFDPRTRTFITPPAAPKEATPPPMVAEYQFAQTPAGGGFRGTYQEFVVQREAAKRPPPGVIGTTGKTPPVAAAEQKRVEGATQAQDILDTLRASYDELDRLRAIPSEQRNALSNAIAYVAGTGIGQTAGRVVGTKEQTQRDVIASARNQMLNAIKNATGMSAQQLNSNVEFRSWLEALTDPTRSIEANRSILDNMEKFITSGGKYSAKKGAPGAAAPAQASDVAQERANANAAIAAGAPAAAVRARFKEKTGQEL